MTTIINTLHEVFDMANERFYNNELEKPVITVAPDTTSGAYGWCTSWKAWKTDEETGEEEGRYEINITAEHLTRPIAHTIGTMIHEMVHLYNLQNGVKDCSRGGTYHNKHFKHVAEAKGMIVEQHEKYGWCLTTLNDEGNAFVADFKQKYDFEKFEIKRTGGIKNAKSSKKSSSRKYTCPHCGMTIRATKEVRVLCGDCTTEEEFVFMELESSDED